MLDMIKAMKDSEAVEIGLRSGHIVYGKFREFVEARFIVSDPEGSLVFVPAGDSNIAYVKLVAADPEISATMDRLYGKRESIPEEEEPPPRRVDVPPVILSGVPPGRQSAIEQVKEKYRHNTEFTAKQTRYPARIQVEMDNKKDK